MPTANHLNVPRPGDLNLLSPESANRRNSRRPSILPVPDNLGSLRSCAGSIDDEEEDDVDSEDDDIVDILPWTSPSENIG